MKNTAIDLFSGCGGLTLGLKNAGFEVRLAAELDPKACKTYKLNHPDTHLIEGDIRNVSNIDLFRESNLKPGDLDLLAGCPPCQGFSRLRTKNSSNAARDDRNDLIFEFLRISKVMFPRMIMLENVPTLVSDERFGRLNSELSSIGYESIFAIVDAAEFGVPQRRKRLIYLASRVGEPKLALPYKKIKTVRETISSLEDPRSSLDQIHAFPERRSNSIKDLIRRIPKNGGSRRDLGPDYQLACHRRVNGFSDTYGRMFWDKVSPTITSGCINPSKGRFIHPSEDRAITLREAALLQGFPIEYRFDPKHGKEAIALMIGNALPPPLIEAQASTIKTLLSDRDA